jgi:hypothetical protein
MLDSRRAFLASLASAGVFTFLQQPPTPIRSRSKSRPDVPEPGNGRLPSSPQQPLENRNANRTLLLQHEKEFRETAEALFAKVSDLKTQLDNLHTADVFSVSLFKQTQEIEHLAKQLKSRAKP